MKHSWQLLVLLVCLSNNRDSLQLTDCADVKLSMPTVTIVPVRPAITGKRFFDEAHRPSRCNDMIKINRQNCIKTDCVMWCAVLCCDVMM